MKKIVYLLSALLMLTVLFGFTVSAYDEPTKVVDNIEYTLMTDKTGTYYEVTDFFYDDALAATTTKLVIADEIDSVPVKSIKTNASLLYGGCDPYITDKYEAVEQILLPATIEYIKDFSFYGFTNVKELFLPMSLKDMGVGAFASMDSLESIILPPSITIIDRAAFSGCDKLSKVILTSEVTRIDEMAFESCKSLTEFNSPSSLKSIGDYAFASSGLKEVTLFESTDFSWDHVFSNCTNLEKVTIADDPTTKGTIRFGEGAFELCTALKEVYFLADVKEIYISQHIFLENTPENVYFYGTEDLWNKLVSKDEAKCLGDAKVHFLHGHTHSFKRTGTSTACKADGKYVYTCSCGETQTYTWKKGENGHNYSAWKITKEPTYTAYGSQKRTCSICGKVDTQKVAKKKLSTVYNLKATQSSSVIRLTWSETRDATGYRVYQLNTKTGKYEVIASIKDKTTYRVTGLKPATIYKFKVKAYKKYSDGTVVWGTASSAFITATEPTEAKITSAVSNSAGEITINYNKTKNISYKVYYYKDGRGMPDVDVISKTNKTSTHTISGLESGKTYTVKLLPYMAFKDSYSQVQRVYGEYSDKVSVVVQ